MDIQITYHGSLVGFKPLTDAGEKWLTDNLPDDVQCLGNTRFAEPRYAGDIADGIVGDGLSTSEDD